ncbi:MAG: hypothetical protein ACD_75C00615G0003, partial [uncultured bacterium]
MAGEFGKGRHRLGRRAALADDEFPFADIEGFVFADIFESEGAQHRQRVF